MFSSGDAVAITKIDTAKYFDFDVDKCKQYVAKLNPNTTFFTVSARSGEGVDALADWIYSKYTAWKVAK